MIKYFLKGNFFYLFTIFRRGPVVFHSGPVAFHSGSDAKKRPAVKALLANQIASFSWIKNNIVYYGLL